MFSYYDKSTWGIELAWWNESLAITPSDINNDNDMQQVVMV